jgi:seryl-tRNA synthetase
MLDMRVIRDNPDKVREAIRLKKQTVDLDKIIDLDKEWRTVQTRRDEAQHQKKLISGQIGKAKKAGEDATELFGQSKTLGAGIKADDRRISELEAEIRTLCEGIPNPPHESTPPGEDETENVVVREWGEKPEFDFTPKTHLELGDSLNLFDFTRGAKIAGHGFPLLLGMGAKLERAVINFMLDLHTTQHGFTEVFPPFLVNAASAFGTGQLPKMEEDMYKCHDDNLYLIPTAEVPVTNIYRDEILQGDQVPLYHTAYSACFRREAGSHGKDTRGFLRVHQFNKVEMVKFVDPETSDAELETLVECAEAVLQALELPYRVLELCAGDLSFAAAKCYDLELWAPGEKKYLEVSSCSNFLDFQARRMNIRFRKEKGAKPQFIHTLNGSGVATARLLVAIIENYQTDEGTIVVPGVLRDYIGADVLKP